MWSVTTTVCGGGCGSGCGGLETLKTCERCVCVVVVTSFLHINIIIIGSQIGKELNPIV